MREIKFRAWDPLKEQMLKGKPIYSLVGNIFSTREIWRKRRDRLIFLEYTGLKDKNGKEIYEGDILGVEGEKFGHEMVMGHISTEGYYHNYGWRFNDYYFEGFDFIDILGNKNKSITETILGNVHENPELLEEDK